VIVTDDQSSYDAENGYHINENESFGSFCYATNQSELSLQAALTENNELRMHNRYSDLRIQFHRTTRVPENKVTYDLPPDLGCIPLHNVVDFASRLPTEMNKRGGIFFPLYQREAVWLSFRAIGAFSVKVFAGGINAISGLPWKDERKTTTQDYVVVPPQVWLDGVASREGAVKQFVAMPVRSGYSIEQQVSGEETLEGLQVMTTPEFPARLGCWPHQSLSAMYEECQHGRENKYDLLSNGPFDSGRYNMSSSPKEVGLSRGNVLFICYPDIVLYDQKEWGEDGYARKSRASFLYELFLKKGQIDQATSHTVVAVHQLRLRCAVIYKAHENGAEFTLHVSPWISVSELRKLIKDRCMRDRLSPVEFELYHEKSGQRHLISPKQFNLPLWRAELRDYSKVMIQHNPKSVLKLDCHIIEELATILPEHVRIGGTGWSMGLSAGGSIHEKIHKDTNPPDIWIRSAETLLNVQILNSVAYESATGMMAPPTPISSETYFKARLPFFKEYVPAVETAESNKAEDTFAKINTVHEIDGRKGIHFDHSFETGTLVGCTQCRRNICDCM
jgi:hypothetical protein